MIIHRVGKAATAFAIMMLVAATAFGQEDGAGLRRYALFIGSNSGGAERVELAYAGTDAEAMATVMKEMGGVEGANSMILRDPNPQTIMRSFESLQRSIEQAKAESRRVEFLLYYSGHSDETGILLGEDRFEYRQLRDSIINIGADVNIAILDSCSSGAFTRLKGGTRQSPFLIDESVNTKGHAFLTSSSEDEAAQESDTIGGSFFTHYLVSALRGAADSTRDGKVTLNEAYTYAFNETLTRTSTTLAGPQHPGHEISLTGSGDLVLTDLRITSAGVIIAEDVAGRMFIKDSGGRLVAEVRKHAGTPLTFALPAGNYTVTLEGAEDLQVTEVSLVSQSRQTIEPRHFRTISPEVAQIRGNAPSGSASSVNSGELTEFEERAAEIGVVVARELVHLKNLLAFLPPKPEKPEKPETSQRIVVHDMYLSLVADAYRIEGVNIGLVNFVDEDVIGAQIGGVANFVGNDVYGAQLSGVFNINDGNVSGFQGASVFNISNGRVMGGQSAGVFNINDGDAAFFQGAGVFNINGGAVSGFQGAGVFNINEGPVHGFQGAGVFNINEDKVNGAQVAGVLNLNEGDVNGFQGGGVFSMTDGAVHGVQASGVFNSARRISGVQASLVNVSGPVDGAQFGLVNVGGVVNGSQVGLINISKEMHGIPLGLINISGNGLFDPSLWSDEIGMTYLGMQMGAGWLYTLFYAGADFADPSLAASIGLGLGIHSKFGPFYLDLDISAKSIGSGADSNGAFYDAAIAYETLGNFGPNGVPTEPIRVYPSLRATLGFTIYRNVAVFAGLALDGHIPGVTEKTSWFHNSEPWVLAQDHWWTPLELYPRWFAGFRL